MRLLLRIVAIAVAGAVLYEVGSLNAAAQLRPSPAGGLFTATLLAAALVLLAIALTGVGQDDARGIASPSLVGPMRAISLFVSIASLVALAWLRGIPYPPVHDATPYHNDAIAFNECAAQALLRGDDPYRGLSIFTCYDERRLGPDRTTPLKRGAFADVEIYPTEEQLDAAWDGRQRDVARCLGCIQWREPSDFEFVSRPSYPALSIVLIAPLVAFGWDANVLYVLCLFAAMALILLRTTPSVRPFVLTGLLGAVCLTAFTVGGSADLLYALPLVAAWLWRERRWSALALGIACSVKQLAWPFAALYLIQVATQQGSREAARRAAVTAGLFGAVNAPFVLWDARAWLLGILTPVVEPMFPRGVGLVGLSTSGLAPFLPASAYLMLEAIAAAAVLLVAWRTRRTSPELGVVLAMVPLAFASRSLFSYFFLLPLFAFAAIARMPAEELSSEVARASGAVTFLAMPAPERSAART